MKGSKIIRNDFKLKNKRGFNLECSFFEHKNPPFSKMPCVIYLHANGCNRLEGLQFLELILNSQISLFCFDFTACGKSEGQYSSIGWFEQNDIETVVQYIISTGRIDKIALWGRSMGAVSAILYAENDPGITCIVVDSCFMSFKLLVKEIAKNKASIPGFIASGAFSVLRKTIKKKADFDLNSIKPIKVVEKIKTPALFGHGSQDTLIPPEHTKELYKNYGGLKQIVIFEGDHNSPRPVNFVLIIREFLKKHLVGDRKSEVMMTKKSKVYVNNSDFGIKNNISGKNNDQDLTHKKITHLLTQRNNIQSSQIIDTDREVITDRGNNNRGMLNSQDSQKIENFIINSNDHQKVRHYRYSSLITNDNSFKTPDLNEPSILFDIDSNTVFDKNDKKPESLDNTSDLKDYSHYTKSNVKKDNLLLTKNLQKSQLLNMPTAEFMNYNSIPNISNHGNATSRLYGHPTDKISSSSELESILYTQKRNKISSENNIDKMPHSKDSNTGGNSHSKIASISNVNQLKFNSSQQLTLQVSTSIESKNHSDISSPTIYKKSNSRDMYQSNNAISDISSPTIYKKSNSRDMYQSNNAISDISSPIIYEKSDRREMYQSNNAIPSDYITETKILNKNLDLNRQSKVKKMNLDTSNQNLIMEQPLPSPSYMFRNPLTNSITEKDFNLSKIHPVKNFFDLAEANPNRPKNLFDSALFNNDLPILRNDALQSPTKNASKIMENFCFNSPYWPNLDSGKKNHSNSSNDSIYVAKSNINNNEILTKLPISHHNAIPIDLKFNDNYTDLKFDKGNASQYDSSLKLQQSENIHNTKNREIHYSSRN